MISYYHFLWNPVLLVPLVPGTTSQFPDVSIQAGDLTGQIKETGRTKLGAEVIQPFNFSKQA